MAYVFNVTFNEQDTHEGHTVLDVSIESTQAITGGYVTSLAFSNANILMWMMDVGLRAQVLPTVMQRCNRELQDLAGQVIDAWGDNSFLDDWREEAVLNFENAVRSIVKETVGSFALVSTGDMLTA